MQASEQQTDRPPYPPRIRWWTSLRASLAGRRDARTATLPDPDGNLPFTRRLAALSHDGQTRVAQWLHTHIEACDRDIAAAAEVIADTRRTLTRVQQRLDDVEGTDASTISPGDAIRNAREATRLRTQRDAEQERASAAAAVLAEFLSSRRHILDRARAAAVAWQTRFDHLAACHRRGYLRRRKTASQPVPYACLPPLLAWTTGDLPLLTSVIDTDAREIITVAMTPFDAGPSRSPITSGQ